MLGLDAGAQRSQSVLLLCRKFYVFKLFAKKLMTNTNSSIFDLIPWKHLISFQT